MNSRLFTDTYDLEKNKNYSATHDADSKTLTSTIKLEDENIGNIRFYPPLFMQRYSFTAKVLEKHDVKWVGRSSFCCFLFFVFLDSFGFLDSHTRLNIIIKLIHQFKDYIGVPKLFVEMFLKIVWDEKLCFHKLITHCPKRRQIIMHNPLLCKPWPEKMPTDRYTVKDLYNSFLFT